MGSRVSEVLQDKFVLGMCSSLTALPATFDQVGVLKEHAWGQAGVSKFILASVRAGWLQPASGLTSLFKSARLLFVAR